MNPEDHPGSCSIVGDTINYTHDTLSTEELRPLPTEDDFLEKLNHLSWYFPRSWPGGRSGPAGLGWTPSSPRSASQQPEEDPWQLRCRFHCSVLDTMNSGDLLRLLCEDENWASLVVEAELSREEAEAAREGLREQALLRLTEITEELLQEKSRAGNFGNSFPKVKAKLGKRVAQLRELADRADHVHKASTISNIVANSTGLLSGVMTIVGLGLIPVTGGVSVGLSMSAVGLGATSAVITGTTSLVEHSKMSSIEVEAKVKAPPGIGPVNLVRRAVDDSKQRVSSVAVSFKMLKRVAKHARATEGPNLVTWSSILSHGVVQKVLGNTAKTMTKWAKVMGGASMGASVLWDVYSLMQASMELREGAKTELAEQMRQKASELEKMLVELSKFHESLR